MSRIPKRYRGIAFGKPRPTQKQLDFADSLGVTLSNGMTKWTISEPIDTAIAQRGGHAKPVGNLGGSIGCLILGGLFLGALWHYWPFQTAQDPAPSSASAAMPPAAKMQTEAIVPPEEKRAKEPDIERQPAAAVREPEPTAPPQDERAKERDIERQRTEEDALQRERQRQDEAKLKAGIDGVRWRTWTSADGNHTLEAKFLHATNGVIHLQKRDGTTLALEKEKLSDEDWKWIKNGGWKTSPQ
jgi:SLA1 Homology Domain 1 (SHD1) protein